MSDDTGKNGHFLPNIWDGEALTDAGAMRLPLTPQTELDCRYKRYEHTKKNRIDDNNNNNNNNSVNMTLPCSRYR